ncbi:MAG: DUF4301 family protein [Bacteroidales bacterium]|nr:DUF4301 family protein [Candidatus Sodaliphilus fimicaballi]
MLNNNDLALIADKGITEELIKTQLDNFNNGFPSLKIDSVATVGNGIVAIDDATASQYIKKWNAFKDNGGTIEKFVPASGAASRMFKNMFAFVTENKPQPETDFEKNFFNNITKFAFYPILNKACVEMYNLNITELIEASRYVDVARAMLDVKGLNYGALPKGLLKFHHAAAGTVHTPVEEHLEEGAQYAASNGVCNLHFTVSPEHRKEFKKILDAKVPNMEKVWGVTYNVTMSEQKASTDTIAVTNDNTPYRDANGNLLFRPAGHGALIENLNERDAQVIFVKNIDNVVPSRLRNTTLRYKKVIAGYLVDTQEKIAKYLQLLDEGNAPLKEILEFVENSLFTHNAATTSMDEVALAQYLRGKLNRPIRVCGMVRNEGEPGGGPYLAYNNDGSYSPQILEAAQIDENNPDAVALMKSGTHFNPVDLVCYIKDYKGNKFNLKDFVDYKTGLISEKSKDGVAIKALELPGLWNGSMSDWNTIFVEVPIETFNPVKTVNDLLRPQHQ